MILTKINETKKGRIALYIDDEFYKSIEMKSWVEAKLTVGSEISIDELERIIFESDYELALSSAFNFLSYQSQTKKRLMQKLRDKFDCEEEVLEAVILRIEELGLVDDLDYATRYAKELFEKKGYGSRLVLQKLREKGIDREISQEALEEFNTFDEWENALEVLKRKYRNELSDTEKKRASAMLVRNGYSYDDVRRALREFCEIECEDD